MGFRQHLVAVAAFAAVWLVPVGAATADDNARGEEIYGLCAQCHGQAGGGNAEYLAPAIAGFDQWYVENQLNSFRNGNRGLHFDDIPGMRMRPMSMTLKTDEDVTAIAAYVASMSPAPPPPSVVGGDAARGKPLYTACAACHGAKGEGVKAMNGPPLAVTSDWYLLDSLARFKAGVRGWKPADPNGAVMRTMASVLADDQAMRDVVAHIMTFR